MRIAIVSHSHPSVTKGGAEIAAYTLFKSLLKLGLDAIFIATCPENSIDKLRLGSQREYAIPVRPERYEHFYHLAPFDVGEQLNLILKENNTELVNFHHFFNYGIGAIRNLEPSEGTRYVLTFHEFLAICHNHGQMVTCGVQRLCESESPNACARCYPDIGPERFVMRKNTFLDAFSHFDAFVSPSNFLANRFIQWGLPAERFSVIENGLVHLPQKKTTREKKSNWVFGFFGQINPFKGIDIILSAAETLSKETAASSDIKFRIHGNVIGQSEAFLKRFAAAQEDGIIDYVGPYDNESVAQLMAECDYLLVPSKWWENSPVVIQEAFAVGLPVICSGIGGMAEKVANGKSGLHFRMGDHVDFLRVVKLAAEPILFAKLQGGVPRPIDGAAMARRYLALFESIHSRRDN
jgi:glycosyltransferase involved in cell wall biosynthesis